MFLLTPCFSRRFFSFSCAQKRQFSAPPFKFDFTEIQTRDLTNSKDKCMNLREITPLTKNEDQSETTKKILLLNPPTYVLPNPQALRIDIKNIEE